MEADGSDAEDYQKQLQMTALSRSGRNTVAQDFHKAGGGVTTTSTKQQESSRSSDAAGNTTSLFANKGYQQRFIRDLEEFIVQRLTTGSHANVEPEAGKSISTINTPPPAKRSRCSTHDKENQGQAAAAGKVPRVKATQMRDIFQMMVQHYGAQLRTADEQTKRGKSESLEELERILQNNHELTISIKDNESAAARASGCIKYSNGDSGLDDEEEEEEQSRHLDCTKSSKRKQFVPRKIDPERDNLAIWNSIRDKHLSRLMSTKKSCRVCVQRQSSLNIPHHSVSSLILHQRYRHWKPLKQCDLCTATFKQPYQLHLHRKFQHRELAN